MNEENNQIENEEAEWEAPPLPEEIKKESEQPEMSEVGSIFNIFMEPGRTFRDLRIKPRFIIGGLILMILASVYTIGLQQKMGPERIRRFISIQAENNSQFASLPEDQKKANIDLQMTISGVVTYIIPLFVLVALLIGGLLYFLGIKIMGGEGSYLNALSIWIYASLPPSIIGFALNLIVLVLKDADDIDMAASQRGLISANPTAFFDGKSMPVLTTIISTIDVFVIWGLVLAAIGLQKTAKMSSGSAWGVALFFALISLGFRVIFAALNGIPQ